MLHSKSYSFTYIFILFIFVICIVSCRSDISNIKGSLKGHGDSVETNVASASIDHTQSDFLTNPKGHKISSRYLISEHLERVGVAENSFAQYLRNLPLKPSGSPVLRYDGSEKPNLNVYDGVIDLPIGKKDLHQCADAVMRLRAEFLWHNKAYSDIHFNLTNGHRIDYSKWMEGYRIKINGNKTEWTKVKELSNTYEDFWDYMELIFMYAGTLSLSKELKSKETKDLEIGDVFIKGGSPGHAVIVVDMVNNPVTNQKYMLLAQSYMPAQEIQILQNPTLLSISPWYPVPENGSLRTPEWTFTTDQLMSF